ncbi:MAG TPA: carboxymuconolactone decarboxylase family protein [Mycobacteriales bacterium]|jgi:alkylhydroperoxidase family enzyme|nr:carboxymuconolactone decarboxylase family protein [Mycobacteriales bacterium]
MTDLPAAPRIAPLPPSDDGRQLNIFRTLGHNRPLYKGFLALGGHLLGGGGLPAREREIVILRTGFRAASEYEYGQHTRIGRDAGLTDAEIARLVDDEVAGWDAADAALVAMVDELCADDVVSNRTWERLASRWSDAQLMELVVLAGYYRLVSGLLNSVGVALEPDTPGWPEGAGRLRRAPREATS